MPRKLTQKLSLLGALTLTVAACSGGETTSVPRPSVDSTTTTTRPSTTTTSTTRPLSVDGAPRALTRVIDSFYAYAHGDSTRKPAAPKALVDSMAPVDSTSPRRGSATLGVFQDQDVAVVEMGRDTFLAVDDGSGWRIVGGVWPSLSISAYFGDGPRIVAVVGSDARPGQRVDRTRADSIHFVGLDGAGDGAIVGVPRDSLVDIPGHGRRKITGSLATGGPETMMAAFVELTRLPLEGYVLTGFSGFESLLGSVLGGVTVEVPFRINDPWAHVSLEAGRQLLDGAQALGFARARKTVPGGDLTRSEHQGVILVAAARVVAEMGLSALPELLELSEPHILTDLTPEQLLTFSAMAVSADFDNLPNVVAPGTTGSAGGASVVFLSDSAEDLWVDLADGTLETEQ